MRSLEVRAKSSSMEPSLLQAIGPVISVILAQALFIGVSAIIGRFTNPSAHLITLALVGFGCLFVLWASFERRLLGKKELLIIGIAFLTRLSVGTVHYVVVMDTNYFNSPGGFTYLWDFEWFDQSLKFVSQHWQSNGFLSPLPEKFLLENKNPLLVAYCSIGYYFSGDFPLTLAVWNSLHSVYTALLIAALAGHLGAGRRQKRFVLALLSFQPFGMISSMMARDFVGQTWLALAVYLVIVLINWRVLWLLSIPVACVLAVSVRQPYLAIILFGAGIVFWLHKKRNVNVRALIILVIISIIASSGLGVILGGASFGRFYESGLISVDRILGLPFRLLRALVGPFPWFQVFFNPPPAGVEFMPLDFLQAVFNVTLILVVVPRIWKNLVRHRTFDFAAQFGLMYFLSGVIASGVHMSYVSIGLIFLLPEACRATPGAWFRSSIFSVTFFALANQLYWFLGLYASGIIQDLSGGY